MADPIPFLDLITPHRELENELVEVFRETLRTAHFIGGPMVEEFERAFAQFCETRYCVGVNSGTDALRFALIAVGVGPGDAVVTVPNTFIATTEAISQAGAIPEFVDIEERTYNMDVNKLREHLERRCSFDPFTGTLTSLRSRKRVAAIIPVHLYGQMADMDPILALAEQYNLVVIEDACQAHGAEYFSKRQERWCKAGSMGLAAAFSFYPGKNLGACGEAGAITTNDGVLAHKMQMLRDHGQAKKYYHEIEGYNGRLDAVQAGILRVKLRHLPRWNEQRLHCASVYKRLFTTADCQLPAADRAMPFAPCASPLSEAATALNNSITQQTQWTQQTAACQLPAADCITLPYEPSWAKAVYHLYVVRVRNRAELQAHLAEARIGTGIHYPIPLHLQTPYRALGYEKGEFPVAERAASEILSLPMYPSLGQAQQHQVVQEICAFVSSCVI